MCAITLHVAHQTTQHQLKIKEWANNMLKLAELQGYIF